jgi:superfamily II DNA or RNA helicase
MAIAIAAQQSGCIADWRSAKDGTPLSKEVARVGLADTVKHDVAMSGRILRIIRAFAGDMDMMDAHFANMVTDDGKVAVKLNPYDPTGVMPLTHFIDFHAYKGTAFCTAAGGSTFKNRHRSMFDEVTGTNPRLVEGKLIDETNQVVKLVRNQQRMISSLIFPPPVVALAAAYPTVTTNIPLDSGVLSGGVKPLGPFTVKTTGAQNLADGDPRNSATSWTLLVILGLEDADEIVMYAPSVRDNAKKPKITATAKRLAIEQARTKSHRFSSPVLPKYSSARFVNGTWALFSSSGAPELHWSWTVPQAVAVSHASIPAFEQPFDISNVLQMRRILDERRLFSRSPALSAGYEASIVQILANLSETAVSQGFSSQTIRLRLLSMVRNQYETVTMPTPANNGGLGSDQLSAIDGDWLVYLALLCVSRVAPGALLPKLPPNFDVPDARILRIVEKAIADLIVASPRPEYAARFASVLSSLESRYNTPPIDNREPFEYQNALVNKMLDRDRNSVVKSRGHFVSLDTGLGKSFIAALYMLKHGAEFGDARRIVWFTPKNVVKTVTTELVTSWGVDVGSVGVVDSQTPQFNKLINIVRIEDLSMSKRNQTQKKERTRDALEAKLAVVAETSVAVVDEVHLLYNAAIKTSTIRRFVEACPKFVAMTATPTPARGQFVGEKWLADCVGFPLTKNNFLVAAAMMVAAWIELPIEAHEVLVPITLPIDVAAQHAQFLRASSQNWEAAARLVRRATIEAMASKAIELADVDRMNTPGGGVLVFMDNSTEMEEFVRRVASMLGARDYGVGLRGARESNGPLGIVVTTKSDTSGYNFVSAGAIVTGVYAQSSASRHQMRGRIRRVGQLRSAVTYATVYPIGTILELLYRRHTLVDSQDASLEALAKEWTAKTRA